MHSADQLRFKISQLRQDKLIYATESIAVFVLALFASAFLPNLLLRYFYDQATLTEVPAVLEYIPVAAFLIGVGYFIYVMFGNMARLGKIKKLEAELDTLISTHGDHCCEGNCDCADCNTPATMDFSSPARSTSTESVGLLAEKMKSAKSKKSTKRA